MEAIPWQMRPSQQRWKLKLLQAESTRAVDEDTELIYQDAMHQAIQQVGSEHPDVAEAATYLADLYLFLERYQEAEVLYRRALKIYAATLGKDHMLYSMCLRNLAVALAARGKDEEAIKARSEARGIFGWEKYSTEL